MKDFYVYIYHHYHQQQNNKQKTYQKKSLLKYYWKNGSRSNACSVTQSCLTLWDPLDCSPPVSSVHGTSHARILGWIAISFSNAWNWKVKVKSLSRVQLSATPWTAAYQAPPSMRFSRREYRSGVPLGKPKSHKRASGKLKPSPLERDIIFHFSIDYKKIFSEGGKGKFFIFTSLDYP